MLYYSLMYEIIPGRESGVSKNGLTGKVAAGGSTAFQPPCGAV